MNFDTTSPLSGIKSPRKTEILAHRGLVSEFVPENTLKAFADALACGADVIETDIQHSKDGVAMVFHDATLLRLANTKARVSDLTVAELDQVDLGFGKRIPTLEQALQAFPTAKFNLDLKSDGAVEATVSIIEKLHAHERVLISSFSETRRQRAIKLLSTSTSTSAGVRKVLKLYFAYLIGSQKIFNSFAEGSTALQLPTNQGPLRFDRARFIRMANAAKLEVQFWTVNSPNQMLRLTRLGASGIVSDRCDLAIATLRNPESFV